MADALLLSLCMNVVPHHLVAKPQNNVFVFRGRRSDVASNMECSPLAEEQRDAFAQKTASEDGEGKFVFPFSPFEGSSFRSMNAEAVEMEQKERRLPLPMPHKLARPAALPRSKHILRSRFPTWKPYVSGHMSHADRGLEKLAAEIHDLPPATPAAKVLAAWERYLKRGSLSLIIRELGRMRLSFRVLQVISWLQGIPRLWPDEHSLCAAIKALVDAGEVHSAIDLYSQIEGASSSTTETLAMSLAKVDMFEQAVEVVKSKHLASSQETASVYVKLMVAAGSLRMHKVVRVLLEELTLQNLHLRLEDCTAVMALCSKLKMHDEAERLYSEYLQAGLQPNIVMYTVVMKARSRAGKDREAMAVYWEIQNRGLVLDLVAYQVIMSVLGRLGDVSRAAKLFLEMKHNNFSPTPDICNTLLKLYFKDGRFGKAKRILQEMQIMGYVADSEVVSLVKQNAWKH
ncbi:hypothetical protein O6H91_03G018300 [Diphasiastrum complanatum]|uniref:Uncharacterized protein n=1 Tax=Diphasiastrum complanatum TaxID=34168 RepID=A0ACC2E4A4_DIPCM|nr:hypothetical protein O6H91_03G018300 [Diphasiastrum complanatum]